MRLSTEPDRDHENGIAVLHAAFDSGITLLDTADAYSLGDHERGHNERLIAEAIATWEGDRSKIRVATKGGLSRPDGRWEPDARAKSLRARCLESRRALGVESIHLYQLHAPDPRTPLSTSVRALAALRREGLIETIGLCNVTVGQIAEARRITDIASVQIELSIWHDEHLLSGVVEYCIEHGLQVLAYRPLGGPTRRKRVSSEPVLREIAARHGATPQEIALAWVSDLPNVVPIPGATRVESIRSITRARAIRLTETDRELLRTRFAVLRPPATPSTTSASPAQEVVIVMGLAAAGKSVHARQLFARGYTRLNRDESGGTLRDLIPPLEDALHGGAPGVVLDNTYLTRKSRAEVLRAATACGAAVRCVWLTTSLEEAETNAVWRIVSRYGRLPAAEELELLRRHDVAAFPPNVLFRHQRLLEPPQLDEGFSRVDTVPFERKVDPDFVHRGVIISCEGVLLRSRAGHPSPLDAGDVEIDDRSAAALRQYARDGYRILGISWQPGIAGGTQSTDGVTAIFRRMNELTGLDVEVEICPHGGGPPRCWCRKPLPGLGVVLIQRHRLDPARCIYAGAGPHDAGLARRLGIEYRDAAALAR